MATLHHDPTVLTERLGLRFVRPITFKNCVRSQQSLDSKEVASEEALTVFADPLAAIFDDPDHSGDERRELIIGHSAAQRLLIVNFTERGRRTRIIGAREATARERNDYEQER